MDNIKRIIENCSEERLLWIAEFFVDRGKTAYCNEQSAICKEIVNMTIKQKELLIKQQ